MEGDEEGVLVDGQGSVGLKQLFVYFHLFCIIDGVLLQLLENLLEVRPLLPIPHFAYLGIYELKVVLVPWYLGPPDAQLPHQNRSFVLHQRSQYKSFLELLNVVFVLDHLDVVNKIVAPVFQQFF